MTLLSDQHFPRHSHDQYGVGVMGFGGHRSWSGVGSVTAFTGDVITVNPGEMHDGAPLTGGPRSWRMIYFDSAVLAKQVEEEFVGAIELVRPVARDAVMARLFERLFARLTSAHADNLAREESLVCCLMGLLRRHGAKRLAANDRSVGVAKAIRRLDAALDESVSLAELAALSGVSRFKLLRSFAREVGITPHAYLVQKRVRAARRLLASGQSAAQAAIQAGFADQSHMTRTFMRQLGFTPSRYRATVA
jgi:AraC-like DNA-binding protein